MGLLSLPSENIIKNTANIWIISGWKEKKKKWKDIGVSAAAAEAAAYMLNTVANNPWQISAPSEF